MYFAEGLIGTYKGIAVYRVTEKQFIEEKYYKNPNDIFIMEDDLVVKNNIIIGQFDKDRRNITEFPFEKRTMYYVEFLPKESVEEDKSDTMTTTGWESADDILKAVYK